MAKKRTEYPINPDFKVISNVNPPLNKLTLPLFVSSTRMLYNNEKTTDKVKVEKVKIPARDGVNLQTIIYTPKGLPEKNAPCLINYHGGGFVLPAMPYHYSIAKEYAIQAKCKVIFVDYRLAPKYPFPYAVNDCFDTYKWVLDHAEQLGIDTDRIALGGDSAGGNLSTVTCIVAHDNGLKMPRGQMLIYPYISVDPQFESMQKYNDTPMCNTYDVNKYAEYYVPYTSVERRDYVSPMEASCLDKMPDCYMETAEFDCLHDGALLYARKLKACNVHVYLNETKGTVHAYDIVLGSKYVKEVIKKRSEFLRCLFYDKQPAHLQVYEM
ncbi:MAG: alpha/beta hydrolase [Clostridia bacterium]|nr:alpha/beta hydrolase [Clostridia bacterium]